MVTENARRLRPSAHCPILAVFLSILGAGSLHGVCCQYEYQPPGTGFQETFRGESFSLGKKQGQRDGSWKLGLSYAAFQEIDYFLFPLCPYKQQMSAEVEQGKVGLDSGGNVGFEVK